MQDEAGRTCLHLAAVNGHANVVELLTSTGSDLLFIEDEMGYTARQLAINAGFEDIVELLEEERQDNDDEVEEGAEDMETDDNRSNHPSATLLSMTTRLS